MAMLNNQMVIHNKLVNSHGSLSLLLLLFFIILIIIIIIYHYKNQMTQPSELCPRKDKSRTTTFYRSHGYLKLKHN